MTTPISADSPAVPMTGAQASLYQQLLESHTTVISVGHRSTILKFHTQILELDGSGAWRALNAGDYRFEH